MVLRRLACMLLVGEIHEQVKGSIRCACPIDQMLRNGIRTEDILRDLVHQSQSCHNVEYVLCRSEKYPTARDSQTNQLT